MQYFFTNLTNTILMNQICIRFIRRRDAMHCVSTIEKYSFNSFNSLLKKNTIK